MLASVTNKSVNIFLDAKNKGHIRKKKEWKWHVAGDSRPLCEVTEEIVV